MNDECRRSLMGRAHHHSISPVPTPNTLTVQVPHVKAVANQGQSLPNLLSISVPVPVTPALAGTTSTMGKKDEKMCFSFFLASHSHAARELIRSTPRRSIDSTRSLVGCFIFMLPSRSRALAWRTFNALTLFLETISTVLTAALLLFKKIYQNTLNWFIELKIRLKK